jgi:two-component system sensor histidine kinase PilS (NtrC family)
MTDEKFPLERFGIQSARTAIYLLIAGLALFQHLSQRQFFNWDLLRSFYVASALGLATHGLTLPWVNQLFARRRLVYATFIADLLLLSFLLYQTELNQSIFLFMDLMVILLCGVVFGTRGALWLAAGFSILTTVILGLGPDLHSLTFFFLLILNNLAFFSVAAISGMLADQLELQGISLSVLRKINESIVETIPSGLLTLDANGVVVQANPGAARIFSQLEAGRSDIATLLPGFSWREALGAGKRDWVSERGGESVSYALQVLEQSGTADPNYLVVVEDQTQIKKMEFAVRQSEKLAAVGQLAAGIAHEIRNPLAGISGSIELLSPSPQGDDDQRLRRIILKEIDRLNRLISDFLDFAKPEKPPHEIVDLAPMLGEVLDSVRVDAKLRKDVTQERNIMGPLPIRAHHDKLKQAFLNIVINAIQAMDQTEKPVLHVEGAVDGQEVVLRIADNGCGMDESTRKRMFEPFHTTKPKGTGLGLAITLKILESHQGRIFVESEKGRGTQFEIRFPMNRNA